MNRVVAGALLAGWSGIMGLGWFLADARASRCGSTYNCQVNELATRDAFLIVGLLIPFLIAGAVASVTAIRNGRVDGGRVSAGRRQIEINGGAASAEAGIHRHRLAALRWFGGEKSSRYVVRTMVAMGILLCAVFGLWAWGQWTYDPLAAAVAATEAEADAMEARADALDEMAGEIDSGEESSLQSGGWRTMPIVGELDAANDAADAASAAADEAIDAADAAVDAAADAMEAQADALEEMADLADTEAE
jgi:hypothetical protein